MRVISIIRKDLKTLLSDKKALAIILIMPVILMLILSFALKGIFMSDWGLSRVNIAVVKKYDAVEDGKNYQQALNSGLFAQGMGEDTAKLLASAEESTDPEALFFKEFLESDEISDFISYRVESEDKALDMLKDGSISAVVMLPEKFIYNMKVNMLTPFRNEVEIRVLTNPEASFDGEIVKSVVKAYSETVSSAIIGKNVLIEASLANDLEYDSFQDMETVMEDIMESLKDIRVPVEETTLEGRRTITSSDYYAAAMMTMFILFAAGHGGRMILEEKEQYTYQRMMAAGTSRLAILAGKFLVVFLIALLQIIVMTVFSRYALNVQWGDFVSVALIGIAASFAVAGLGAAVAAATYRAGNYKMANIFETAVIQTMALLGGSFFPIYILPEAIQKLSILSLNGIALKAYQKTIMGYDLDGVLGYVGILAGIGAAFAAIAAVTMRGKEGTADDGRDKTQAAEA